MTQKVQLLRSNVAGHTPGTLLPGELAVNTADKKLWAGNASTGVSVDLFDRALAVSTTGQHFAQNGAKISRVADRLFVGGAVVNDGAFPNVSRDWFETFLASTTGGSEPGALVSSCAAVLSSFGTFALLAASRTSDNPTAGSSNTIALSGFAINDNTTQQSNAWGVYAEGRKLAGVENTQTFGAELDVSNQGSLVSAQPYQQLPGGTFGLQLASGCGVALPGNNVTSAALQIVGNPTKFDRGIVFASNAINGTDGVTGAGVALALAKGHNATWFNASGQITSQISGNVATAALAILQVFDDAGLHFKNQSQVDLFDIQAVSSAVNGVTVVAGGVGQPVQLQAFGSDANVNFYVMAKGTGAVNLNNSVYAQYVSSPANQLSLYGNVAGASPAIAATGTDTDIDLTLAAKGAGMVNLGTGTISTASAGAVTLPAQAAGYIKLKVSGTSVRVPYYNV